MVTLAFVIIYTNSSGPKAARAEAVARSLRLDAAEAKWRPLLRHRRLV